MKARLLQIYYRFLWFLARRYIAKSKPFIIGINGSVGKTSCRMIISQTLQTLLPHMSIYTSPKNFNGELWMSLSIFEIEKYTPSIMGMISVLFIAIRKLLSRPSSTNVLILEYGIDHPWEMSFLLSIAKPDVSVHTQIDAVHSLQFWNPHSIAKEEFLLQQNTRSVVFLNADDPYISHVQNTIPCDVISYSANGWSEDTTITIAPSIQIPNVTLNHTAQSGYITYNNSKTISLWINILWRYHLSYAAVWACIADIVSYRLTKKEALQAWQHLNVAIQLQPWRWSIFNGIHDSIIVDSSYNASPRSVKQLLHEVSDRRNKKHPTRKLLFALGDMRELGTQEEKEHLELALFLQSYDASVFLVGNVMATIVEPYFGQHWPWRLHSILSFGTYKEAGEAIREHLQQHQHEKYIIVFKGSQNTIFLEESIKYILANKADESKLTRQGAWRAKTKQDFLTKALQPKGV